MSFAGGVFLIFAGCGLLWIASNGVETPSAMSVYEALVNGVAGKPPTESATLGTGPDDEERPVAGTDPWEGAQ